MMRSRTVSSLAGVVAAAGMLAAGGCNFAPRYERPKLDEGDTFKEAVHGDAGNEGWQLADPRDAALRGNWWELYGDATLNDLEERVAKSNQTVLAAAANYRAARAMVQQAEASFFPTVSLDPSVTRSRSSASVETTGATAASVSGSVKPHTLYSLPDEASYQIDLWGSIRNTVAQDRFSAQASAATLANTLLSTQTTLAEDYFQLRIADEERRVLDTTLEDYQANLRLVQTLYKNGVDSDEDLAQAQTPVQSAMAQATDLGVTRATFEHAIAVLIGVPPSNFSLPYVHFHQTLPPVPVGGVPADLIERRPDIAAAERQVAASNAAIGIARAAFFPTLSLTGSAGYESTALSQLLKWPNRFWSVGPDLAQTLFDGGARRAALAQARAANDAAAANYRQAVLSALQGVEDNLATLRILSQEVVQEHDAAVAAQRAVELSVVRYRNGVDSYVNVITAQNAFLSAREAEVQVLLRQLTASVQLINNLGGGWSTDQWQETERLARRASSEPAKSPPGGGQGVPGSVQGVPNPPPMPAREIKPEELLKQNQEVMGGSAPMTP
jgi:NodT family efflux transporter outer membrane factor (OMF) lipoprotein